MYELKKQISVTAKDYALLRRTHNTTKTKWTRLKPLFIWLFILLITLLIRNAIDPSTLKYDSVAFHIFLFIFIFALMAAGVWGLYFLLKFIGCLFSKLLHRGLVVFKEAEIRINNIGIEIKNEQQRFFVVWDQVERINESEEAFYFYHTPIRAIILPKRYFDSLEEIHRFNLFLKEIQIKDVVTDYR